MDTSSSAKPRQDAAPSPHPVKRCGVVGVTVTVRDPDPKQSDIASKQLAPLRKRVYQ